MVTVSEAHEKPPPPCGLTSRNGRKAGKGGARGRPPRNTATQSACSHQQHTGTMPAVSQPQRRGARGHPKSLLTPQPAAFRAPGSEPRGAPGANSRVDTGGRFLCACLLWRPLVPPPLLLLLLGEGPPEVLDDALLLLPVGSVALSLLRKVTWSPCWQNRATTLT